ncbi:hypothetical protein Tter_2850 [Thermobaculum terrenum ATCC BAA-798]|uniref:Uncharacterized protein n=1 Tax=Thermobaculum terrenum (strain ATCC BAA-798 / CCMEE 7001 / YNP1) TaxID=525904 RepID=D1CJ13_THET1|nr:hypothetical protein [Thermobaculum terrenum]ACZ43733.1 hypothetical protein Tter_2850 [Thermobaculum terrenum ATCC BAA-798]
MRRTTCDHVVLWSSVNNSHFSIFGPFILYPSNEDGTVKLYDLRTQREYVIARREQKYDVISTPKSDGRWVIYREELLNPHQSGEGNPKKPRIFVVDLLTGSKRLLAASHVPGYPQIVSPLYDISQGKAIYRIVKGDPNAPSSEIHIVDLASGKDQLIRSYTWPRYAHGVAIDDNRAVWSLIMAPHANHKNTSGEIYYYDLRTGRGRLLTITGYEWMPDISGRYVIWIRSSGFLYYGRVVIMDLYTGKKQVIDLHCADNPKAFDYKRQAMWPSIGRRVATWEQYCSTRYSGYHMHYDLLNKRLSIVDATARNIDSYADGWVEAYRHVLRDEPPDIRTVIIIYKGADQESLPRMPNAGGGGMVGK